MLFKLCLILIAIAVVSTREAKFFRKDYTYIAEHDAFYKLHWDVDDGPWRSNLFACDNEGADLFYPKSGDEWKVAKQLVQALPEPSNITDIFVGFHDGFGLGEYINIDGSPKPVSVQTIEPTEYESYSVTMDIETGVFHGESTTVQHMVPLPFVCKKVEDVTCPTIDHGYKYVESTKKCYKLNDRPMSWPKAMETCLMEGGRLLVVESEIEASVINNLIKPDLSYFIGFKKLFPVEEFYTVTGQKLKDSGYYLWFDDNSKEFNCGYIKSYNYRLYLNAGQCDSLHLPFVCQINITTSN